MSQRNIVPRLAASAALGGLLYGYDTAVINGATAVIKEHFHTGDAVLGLAVGSALITGCIGALLSGRIADKVGRVPMMKIAAVCFLVCGIGCAFAPNIEILVAFRVFGGFAAGVASVVAPMYITEISPTRQRGVLGSLQQLGIVLGIFVSLLVNALLVHVSGGAGTMMGPMMTWQWMFLCMCVPALIYGVLAFTIPESPRYLVAQGRMDEAAGVLAKIDDAEIDVNGQLAAIRASLSADRKPSFRDLIGSNGRLKPVVLAAIGFMILNQFTGINVIFYYSNSLWSAVGFSEKDSFTITAITSLINIAATVIGMTIIDRVGPQAHAARRIRRHGRGSGRAHGALRHRTDGRRLSRVGTGLRASGAGVRQSVRRRVRRDLGHHLVGDALRDVPEHDARRGHGGRHRHTVAVQLRGDCLFPGAARHQRGAGLRPVRLLRLRLVLLCAQMHA